MSMRIDVVGVVPAVTDCQRRVTVDVRKRDLAGADLPDLLGGPQLNIAEHYLSIVVL